jgi:hypothetical protein
MENMNIKTELTQEQLETWISAIKKIGERMREIVNALCTAFQKIAAIWHEWLWTRWNLIRFSGRLAQQHAEYWLMWSARQLLIRLE